MTTCDSNNIFNIAVKGNFDDCQKIVKQMFSDEKFRDKLNKCLMMNNLEKR